MIPSDAFAAVSDAAVSATAVSSRALALHCLRPADLDAWYKTQAAHVGSWLRAQGFAAAAGSVLLLPGSDGIAGAVLGIDDPHDPDAYAPAPYALPPGDWRVAGAPDDAARRALQLGWGLGAYRYTRYKAPARAPARLVLPPRTPRPRTCWPPAGGCATWSIRRPRTWGLRTWKMSSARSRRCMVRTSM